MRRARTATLALAAVGALAGCGGAAAPVREPPGASRAASPWTTWSDPGARVRVALPPGWHATGRPATAVVEPVQRLLVTSFPVHQRRPDRSCGPATARGQMPPGGAMVFVFEYRGPSPATLRQAPPRPARFALDRRALGSYECLGRSYRLLFREHGRVLQAHVYLGRRAGTPMRRRVLAVLDGMRFGPLTARAAARWVRPTRVLSHLPDLRVACPRPNRFACDRVGLAVTLRRPALAVEATVHGRALRLDDRGGSGRPRQDRGRRFAGVLHPAGLVHGPLALHADDGPGRWTGRRPASMDVALEIHRRPGRWVRTSLVVPLAPGWG